MAEHGCCYLLWGLAAQPCSLSVHMLRSTLHRRKLGRLATHIVKIIFQVSVSQIWTNLSSPADKKRLPVLSKATTLTGEVAVCMTASPEAAILHARRQMLSFKVYNKCAEAYSCRTPERIYGNQCEQLPPQSLLPDAEPRTRRTSQACAVAQTPSLASFVSASAVSGPW